MPKIKCKIKEKCQQGETFRVRLTDLWTGQGDLEVDFPYPDDNFSVGMTVYLKLEPIIEFGEVDFDSEKKQ